MVFLGHWHKCWEWKTWVSPSKNLLLVPIFGGFMVNANVPPYKKFNGVVPHNLSHPIVEGQIPVRNIVQWFDMRAYLWSNNFPH